MPFTPEKTSELTESLKREHKLLVEVDFNGNGMVPGNR